MRTEHSNRRHRYTDWQLDLLRRKYHLCRSTSDRQRLFSEAGIGSLSRGFNAAQRAGLTRPQARSARTGQEPRYEPRYDPQVHLRRDPLDRAFDAADDDFLLLHWHGVLTPVGSTRATLYVEEIAVFLNRSVWSVAVRARELGLRNVPLYYDASKLLAWTQLSFAELRSLLGEDADASVSRLVVPPALHPVADRSGTPRIILVSATAFARALLAAPELAQQLVAERDADAWFLLEAVESLRAVAERRARFEPSVWIGYDSTSLCPVGKGFGRPLDDDASKETELRLDPRALSRSAGFADDTWKPGRWREQADQALLLATSA